MHNITGCVMSRMASDKSPRSLLNQVTMLHDNLHDTPLSCEDVIGENNAGFILKKVETLLLSIRNQLDVAPVTSPDVIGSSSIGLMLRLRDHVTVISTVLTGHGVSYEDENSTTLHELIRCTSHLNQSVSNSPDSFCRIQ